MKCRGREYLRIIYGPEYTLPEHLERLRERRLSLKRSLALCEFALGIEGLEQFVQREPLSRVHECVFGVVALESEPVDPRLYQAGPMTTRVRFPPPGFDDLSVDEKIDYLELLWSRIAAIPETLAVPELATRGDLGTLARPGNRPE